MWDYEQGTELRDPSFKEVADYYARLLSWYTKGGFTDELGKRHESGTTIPFLTGRFSTKLISNIA